MKDIFDKLIFLKCQEVEAFTGFWKWVKPIDYKGEIPFDLIKEMINDKGMVRDFIRLPDRKPINMCRN